MLGNHLSLSLRIGDYVATNKPRLKVITRDAAVGD
jgi:hypothetical protein